jgi:hypothetical protein
MEMSCVFFAAGTECLNIIWISFGFRGLKPLKDLHLIYQYYFTVQNFIGNILVIKCFAKIILNLDYWEYIIIMIVCICFIWSGLIIEIKSCFKFW